MKDDNLGPSLFSIGITGLIGIGIMVFLPFGLAGRFLATAATFGKRRADEGNWLYAIFDFAYGYFGEAGLYEAGWITVAFVALPFIARPVAKIAILAAIFCGAGIALLEYRFEITPWAKFNDYGIPLLVGAVQAIATAVIFPRAEEFGDAVGALADKIAIGYCWIGPVVFLAVAGMHHFILYVSR